MLFKIDKMAKHNQIGDGTMRDYLAYNERYNGSTLMSREISLKNVSKGEACITCGVR